MAFDLPYPDLTAERLGNTDTPGVWLFDSGKPGPTVMLTALTHGNELCGAWALKDLLAAGVRPQRGRLIVVFANLDAYDRFDPAHHDASRFVEQDMNRVWDRDVLAHPVNGEQRRAQALLPWVEQADWLLDLHSMHEKGEPLLLTGVLPRNIELARQLGAPEYVIVDAGHKDGVRMRDFGRFGDPDASDALALLIECGYHGDLQSHRVGLDMVARFLAASGIVAAEAMPDDWRLPDPAKQTVLQVTDAVVAPSMDVTFAQPWQGLECLEAAGTPIATMDGRTVGTPYANCSLIMPSLRQLKPGVTVVRLARTI